MPIDRIAFYTPNHVLLHHYDAILAHLDASEFEIVISSDGNDAEIIRAHATARGWSLRHFDDIVRSGDRYRACVSNHPGNAILCPVCNVSTCEHVPEMTTVVSMLSELRVRLLYSHGKSDWNLRDWNELYDLILVFGPRQAAAFSKFKRPRVLQVGYPRYDRLVRGEIDVAALAARFGLDPSRETVVWLPTWSEGSSIETYAEPVARLSATHNVVVKPHPHTIEREPHRTKLLRRFPYTALVEEPLDSVETMALADIVLADYGGSSFGAIYADRKLLLLNVPSAPANDYVGTDSFDTELRKCIPSVEFGNADWMGTMLENESIWSQQIQERARLRDEYFAPTYGFSGELAATALRNVEQAVGRSAPMMAEAST